MPRGKRLSGAVKSPTSARNCIAPSTVATVHSKKHVQTADEQAAERAGWAKQLADSARSTVDTTAGHAGAAVCINPSAPAAPPTVPRAITSRRAGDLTSRAGTAAALSWAEGGDDDDASASAAAAAPPSPPAPPPFAVSAAPAAAAAAPSTPGAPAAKAPLRVGYWAIRGLGAPLRMMCAYSGAPFATSDYEAHAREGGGWDVGEWFEADKPALAAANPLMNLPYVVDGDVVVSQSNACMSYLARKFGLAGAGGVAVARAEQVMCQVTDLRNDLVKLCYSADGADAAARDAYGAGTAAGHFGKLEKWLAVNGTLFSADDVVSVSDFHLWEMLDQHAALGLFAATRGAHPLLHAFYERFAALPRMKPYLDGDAHRLPCNNKMASLGGGC